MKYKITVPEPCDQSWDKMTPNENGRFCLSCSKTVIDFTAMLPEEIQHFFIQNRNESICGRFRKSQLDSITIQIPDRILYTQTNYHKMFLLALFIAMGTTLFSCQDKEGNKKKIDKIEVVEDTTIIKKSPEKVKSETKNSTTTSSSSKANIVTFKKPKPIVCGEKFYAKEESTVNISEKKTSLKDSVYEDESVYVMGAAIETAPYYPDGIENFYQFFINEFQLPDDIKMSNKRILVSFVIGRDGSLSSFKFPQNTDPKLSEEIERVLEQAPKWMPGTQNGKKTMSRYSMPIVFE